MEKTPAQHTYGHERWSDTDQQQIGQLLAKKLSKDTTASRVGAGNSRFTYVESWRAIQLANAIFGFNGWSCSVVDISPDFIEEEQGRFSVGVTAVVRVTLKDGTFHEDVGYGNAENPKRGPAIDKAKKEAVSDARKRALRLFGDALGNCLYDKSHLKRLKSSAGNTGEDLLDVVALGQRDGAQPHHHLVKTEPGVTPSPPHNAPIPHIKTEPGITPSPPQNANGPANRYQPYNNPTKKPPGAPAALPAAPAKQFNTKTLPPPTRLTPPGAPQKPLIPAKPLVSRPPQPSYQAQQQVVEQVQEPEPEYTTEAGGDQFGDDFDVTAFEAVEQYHMGNTPPA